MAAIPSRVRFTRERRGGVFLLETPANVLPTSHPISIWYEESDRIAVQFSTRFAGVAGSIESDELEWVGTISTFTDVLGTQQYQRPIRFTPAPCDSPPPVSIAELRVLPREIGLRGLPNLTLGEPVPGAIERYDRPGSAIDGLRAETEGVFWGADSIRIFESSTDARVYLVSLLFSPEQSRDGLIEVITARWGPPDSQGPGWPPSWTSPTTRLKVDKSDHAGWTQVWLEDPRFRY